MNRRIFFQENEDIPSRETVLDVNSDLIAEEDADKKVGLFLLY